MTTDQWLWALAIGLFLVGDGATTAAGLHIGLEEASPTMAPVLDAYGFAGVLAAKSAVVATAAAVWTLLPVQGRRGAPAALALVGAVVTANNVLAICAAVV